MPRRFVLNNYQNIIFVFLKVKIIKSFQIKVERKKEETIFFVNVEKIVEPNSCLSFKTLNWLSIVVEKIDDNDNIVNRYLRCL